MLRVFVVDETGCLVATYFTETGHYILFDEELLNICNVIEMLDIDRNVKQCNINCKITI